MITLIAFVLILSLLVFVHELGHFVVAKKSGITVEEFAIGFPPRAIKLWQDEGEITLNGRKYIIGRKLHVPRTIQPGAQVYAETGIDEQGRPVITTLDLVEPVGEDDNEHPQKENNEEEQESSPLAKFFRPSSVTVEERDDRPTVMVEELVRPTEYTINWIPFGGYVRMVGEEDPTDPGSFASKSKKVRFAVLVAGSAMNLVAAVFFFTLTSLSGVPEPILGINLAGEEDAVAQTIVTAVVPNTPAEESGIQVEDIITGANDTDFNYIGDLIYFIDQNKGKEVDLHLKRGEEEITTSIVPREKPPKDEGAMGIGITYDVEEERVTYPLPEAIVRGFTDTAQYVALVFYMPIAILQDIIPAEAARPTGPVGIYQQTESAVNWAIDLNWWFPILWLTAILSTALAVTNLLPLPALDGGRIFFILIEAVRGKRVAPEKEGAIHFIGLALLVTLMLVISYYDVSNPIPTINWNNPF